MRNELRGNGAGAERPRAARRPLVLGIVLGIVGAVLCLLPATLAVEQGWGLALLFKLRGPTAPPAGTVVVGISAESAAALGLSPELDTWSRGQHAELVARLAADGASVVAFDLLFHEAREGPGDAQFAAAIERAGNVLLAARTRSEVLRLAGGAEGWKETWERPIPELDAAALGSAPFVLPTVPVFVGQFWTFGRGRDDLPSLPAAAVQAHLLPLYDEFVALVERARPGATADWPATQAAVRQRRLEETMTRIRRAFQNDAGLARAVRRELARAGRAPESAALAVLLDLYAGPGSRYLNFYGPARAIATVPYDRALAGVAPDLAGKVVFVGMSEPHQPEQQDDFISVFSESTGVNLSGVELGATAVANLLERSAIVPLPLPLHAALVLALGVAFGALVARPAMARASAFALGAGALYFGVAYWQFASHHVWLPLVVPLLGQLPFGFVAATWWNYRELAEQRERVRTALGYYVPPAVARRLTEQTLAPGADRELLHGTCLVTDAERYTTVAERLSPDALAALMNDYYEAIFRVVRAHGGEISDTAGDSMIAVWASSRPDAAVRRRALQASVDILAAVREFNARHADSPLPTRIGLESGQVLLASIGAEQRYEYRAIGDIVNTASRIEALNEPLGTRVLVSAAARDGVDLPARDVGTFLLRNKRQPVRVFEPLAAAGPLDAEFLAAFAAALAALRAGEWRAARDGFAALAARAPDDGPVRYYAALSRAMFESPPAEWTGAVAITAK